MKLTFNVPCYDKYNGAKYNVGEVIEVSEERGRELISASVASELPDEKPTKKTKKKEE